MPFRPFNFIKDSYICDVVSAVLKYHGFYKPGNSGTTIDLASAQFLIGKEVIDASGNTTSMKFSGQDYNQIWNNRATSVVYD
jgi:hypothetical protein